MKISRKDSNAHQKAMDLICSDKRLTQDEKVFILENYNPMAEHNVGKAGIFFTPQSLAWDFAVITAPKGRVIDLCAGIGSLAYNIWNLDHNGGGGEINELVCLEICHDFVQVGKRVLPEAVWIEGDVFDQELLKNLGMFDTAISNPPFGSVIKAPKWVSVKSPAHLAVVEVGCRLAYNGIMVIIPAVDAPNGIRSRRREPSENLKRFTNSWPNIEIYCQSIDTEMYKDEWKGVVPDVEIVDFDLFNCQVRPLGFGEKPIAIDLPASKCVQAQLF